MATYTGANSYHKTLSGTTADTLTLANTYQAIEVTNRSDAPAATLYIAVGATTATPVAGANGTDFVRPGESVIVDCPGDKTIRVVGSANDYSVVGISDVLAI